MITERTRPGASGSTLPWPGYDIVMAWNESKCSSPVSRRLRCGAPQQVERRRTRRSSARRLICGSASKGTVTRAIGGGERWVLSARSRPGGETLAANTIARSRRHPAPDLRARIFLVDLVSFEVMRQQGTSAK